MNETCEICGHLDIEHDGMGACYHEDKRTATGYCSAHNNSAQ